MNTTAAPRRHVRHESTTRVSRRQRAPVVFVGPGLVTRRVRVAPQDVVFVKGLIEASEGLGALFAERGGDLLLVATDSRSGELDELLTDLEAEVGAIVTRA
ncbi:MAG: DUF4911 domain-containing protein [Polyangiaceae bacterium]|nr:DUF4911 domain-containing protein [Polyangiaceae bacterium]